MMGKILFIILIVIIGVFIIFNLYNATDESLDMLRDVEKGNNNTHVMDKANDFVESIIKFKNKNKKVDG